MSPWIFLVVEDVIYHAQLNDRVTVGGDACVEKKVGYILQSAIDAIEQVFAISRAVVSPGDGDVVVFDGQQIFGIFEA